MTQMNIDIIMFHGRGYCYSVERIAARMNLPEYLIRNVLSDHYGVSADVIT